MVVRRASEGHSHLHLQNIQPATQVVHDAHDAVFVHVDVVDAVGVGALVDLGDGVGDLFRLEGIGGVERADAAVGEGGVD